MNTEGFIRSYRINLKKAADQQAYPYSIPAIRDEKEIKLSPHITFFVGENGSGKSTIIEALAINSGFNAEGGSKHFTFSTKRTESTLHEMLQIVRNPRKERTGFFLRAESFYNVATNIDDLDNGSGEITSHYGGKSLHHRSHGESFMALIQNRFYPNGLYILDEPEAALSPSRQLGLLSTMHKLIKEGCQFIIATHSPILLGYPDAYIYHLDQSGIQRIAYKDTTHYQLTKDFLNHPELYTKRLFQD